MPKKVTVFFGTYTRGWPCDPMKDGDCTSQGIYSATFDTETGAMSAPKLAAESDNPSYLTIAPNRKFLYAVNEVGDFGGEGSKVGSVSAFAIKADGKLTELNKVSSLGADPTHIWITRSGKTVLAANYSGGSVVAFGVQSNGKLKEGNKVQHKGTGPNKDRQEGPHAHFVIEGKNGLIYVADLGVDKVFIYKLDEETAMLTPNDPPFATLPPGSGPRHIAFHPTQNIVYVNAELTSKVVVFKLESDGGLTQQQEISALPPDADPDTKSSTAEVQVSADGKWLYVSVRGTNNIGVFSISSSGKLKFVDFPESGGTTPRDFKLAPGGKFVLVGNQASNNVSIYKVDGTKGKLKVMDGDTAVSKPVNFAFLY